MRAFKYGGLVFTYGAAAFTCCSSGGGSNPHGASLAPRLWALRLDVQQSRLWRGNHTPSLASAELFAAILSLFRRDVAATQGHAEALMALAAAEGFALCLEQGRILRGWALAMQGDAVAGVAHIHQGLLASQGIGPELLRPYWLAFLAED